MDPVSLTLVTVSAATVLIRFGSLVNLVRRVRDSEEPALDRIRIGLLTEFYRFKAWCHAVGADQEGGLENARTRLPPDTRKAADIIIRAYDKWMSKSVQSFNDFGIIFDPDDPLDDLEKKRDLKFMIKRVRWRLYGFKDVDGMLHTIQTLNTGLERICKPIISYDEDQINQLINIVKTKLPSYDESIDTIPLTTSTELSRVSLQSSQDYLQTTTSLQENKRESFKQKQNAAKTVEYPSQTDNGTPQKQISRDIQLSPSETVFQQFIQLLNAIIRKLESSLEYEQYVSRLRSSRVRSKIWASCAFTLPYHLDQMLNKKNENQMAFKSSITGILADLMLTTEILLESLLAGDDRDDRKILLKSHEVLSFYEDFFEDALDLPEAFYDADFPEKETIDLYIEEIAGLVDCLFDTISFVRRLQDIRYVELESQASKVLAAIESEVVDLEQSGVQEKSDIVVNTTLEMMMAIKLSIEEAQESEARKVADSLAFADAVKRIEEWDKQIERMKAWSKTLGSMTQDPDSPDLVEKNIKIVQTLATMAYDVASALPTTGDPSVDLLQPQITDLNSLIPSSGRAMLEDLRILKIKEESKSAADAFEAVQLANKIIEYEVIEYPVSKERLTELRGPTLVEHSR